ncbi:MAG: hypothetical protein ACPHL6_05235, partial [Rubripirellula sp.]
MGSGNFGSGLEELGEFDATLLRPAFFLLETEVFVFLAERTPFRFFAEAGTALSLVGIDPSL